jgi:DNA-binding protein H-NS
MSKKLNLESMSIDEMWQLHERIIQILSNKLTSEKRELEKRLAKLRQDKNIPRPVSQDQQAKERVQKRRKYPRVLPRYRNPDNHSETWSGRGKQPRWLAAALTRGRTIEDFKIAHVEQDDGGAHRAQL